MTHPTLTTPESRACIEALYAANPDGTAELLAAFPEAVFSWCDYLPHRKVATKHAEPKPTVHIQERML